MECLNSQPRPTAPRPPLCKGAARSEMRRPIYGKFSTSSHISGMVSHIKTTFNIDDTVMARLRKESLRQGRTMSELVEAALRLLFQSGRPAGKTKLPPLPRRRSGGHLINISNREALYEVMESRR